MNTYIKTVPSQSSEYLNKTWEIKEEINDKQSLLRQNWSLFSKLYRKGEIYLIKNIDEEVIGYALVNSGDYISILAIHPSHQGAGFGTELMHKIKREYDFFYLHVRTSNKPAVRFYKRVGLGITDYVINYYDNNDKAYIMSYRSSE